MRLYFTRLWLVIVFLLVFCSVASSAEVGMSAPSFSVKSGDGQTLTLDAVKGKVISLIYETKEVVEENRKLKTALRQFRSENPELVRDNLVSVPVINCSSASWAITKIWQFKLKENSQKEGLTIYGDWDGRMFADYGMKDKTCNVLLIDKKGIIRYTMVGRVPDEEIPQIIDLLKTILSE